MAFLVSYSQSGNTNWRDKAIYLDQHFYEQIFNRCKAADGFRLLGSIAALGYGDQLLMHGSELSDLATEIDIAKSASKLIHPQADQLKTIALDSLSMGLDLAVSGDMYPVLVTPTGSIIS